MSIEEYLNPDLIKNIQDAIDQTLEGLPDPTKDRIKEYVTQTRGKMIRPSIVVNSAMLLNGVIDAAMKSAICVELMHNMSLIHDDILDGAPLRRGKASYHRRHGVARAINDGDVLLTYALSTIKHEPTLKILLEVSLMVGEGQILELEFRANNDFNFTPRDAIRIMDLKTAGVFNGCLRLGFLAADRLDEIGMIGHYAQKAGIAFQIQDDILDIIGEEKIFGKKHFWDIQESKRSLFLAYALQTDHRSMLEKIFNVKIGEKTEEEVECVVAAFHDVLGDVKAVKQLYLKEATEGIRKEQERAEKEDISELCDYITTLSHYLCTRSK
ncbi:MAG: polyprenyl synthetase family protein [Promethearchaeota archaeon]